VLFTNGVVTTGEEGGQVACLSPNPYHTKMTLEPRVAARRPYQPLDALALQVIRIKVNFPVFNSSSALPLSPLVSTSLEPLPHQTLPHLLLHDSQLSILGQSRRSVVPPTHVPCLSWLKTLLVVETDDRLAMVDDYVVSVRTRNGGGYIGVGLVMGR
jgi:hypothetical protein